MEEQNYKGKVFSGTFWKFMERFLAQGITLAVSIVIARILNPSDYSTISIVLIFFTFANIIISGGLNTALIQKKDANSEDYTIVLFVSVLLSFVLFIGLFFIAPIIAEVYDEPLLVPLFRIMGVLLPINAVKSIWCAYISSTFQFKKFFFATLGGTLSSAVVGVLLALKGFGVWALVAQQLTNSVIDTIILILSTRIGLTKYLSFKNLRVLFAYGWKVFVSSIIATAYNEVTPLIIGLRFSKDSLSYYTKGRSFPITFSSATTNTLSSVLFPFLAKVQDDKDRVLGYTRRYMQLASYVSFPIMLGFFAIADKFVLVLLTEKWLSAVYFLRVFCVCCMFDVIAVGNCETIKAIGKSGVYLVMEIIKKSLYLFVIVMFVLFSSTPEILTISSLVCVAIQITVNTIPNIKLIGYRFKDQLMDIVPNLCLSVVMAMIVYFLGFVIKKSIICLIVQVVVGITLYLMVSVLVNNRSYYYIKETLASFIKRKR